MATIANIYNFLSIDDTLSTSGQPTERQIFLLAADHYDVIVNLALNDDPRYALPDERGLVERLGLIYIHIPVLFDNPTEDNLLAFFDTMEMVSGKKVHLHCAANMRVTAFLGLYYMIKLGKTEAAAFEPMESIWQPDEIWSEFIADMASKHLRQSRSLNRG